MSGSGRHSNNDIPFNPYSSSWVSGDRMSNQQYLSPENAYRGSQNSSGSIHPYHASSYQTSRHSDESHPTGQTSATTPGYYQPLYTQISPSYQQMQGRDGSSRHDSSSATSYSKRQSASPAVRDERSYTSHSSRDSGGEYSRTQSVQRRHSDDSKKKKDKGKYAEDRRQGRKSGNSRHEDIDPEARRGYGPALPPGEKLVNGVFLRY